MGTRGLVEGPARFAAQPAGEARIMGLEAKRRRSMRATAAGDEVAFLLTRLTEEQHGERGFDDRCGWIVKAALFRQASCSDKMLQPCLASSLHRTNFSVLLDCKKLWFLLTAQLRGHNSIAAYYLPLFFLCRYPSDPHNAAVMDHPFNTPGRCIPQNIISFPRLSSANRPHIFFIRSCRAPCLQAEADGSK